MGTSSPTPSSFPDAVRAAWPMLRWDEVEALSGGLINATWRVRDVGSGVFVAQRVNRIFDPRVHENIAAVTGALREAEVPTYALVSTAGGDLFVTGEDDHVYRVLEVLEGSTVERFECPAQARAAGRVLAQFHAGVADLRHTFVGMRVGVHDTAAHLQRLRQAVARHTDHRLHGAVVPLTAQLEATVEALPSLDLEVRVVGHGDPKAANLMVRGGSSLPYALIDLDTVGPIALAHELGDALRSWCNASSEDDPTPRFDSELHAASVEGYVEGYAEGYAKGRLGTGVDGVVLAPDALVAALAHGLPWICLELAARFLADALEESYFGWDPEAFSGRGEHNLHRARGQWGLAQQVLDATPLRLRQIGDALEILRRAGILTDGPVGE